MSDLLDAVADCLDSAPMALSHAEALEVGHDHDTEGLDSLVHQVGAAVCGINRDCHVLRVGHDRLRIGKGSGS